MNLVKKQEVEQLSSKIDALDEGYRNLITDIVDILSTDIDISTSNSPPFDMTFAKHFAGLLLVHHATSSDAFTKDKFEHALQRVMNEAGHPASLSNRGHPGHDITVNDVGWSLKTQGDKKLSMSHLHISKFMELGGGTWTDVESLKGLRDQMLKHLGNYERIFSLRYKSTIIDNEKYAYYELVEIPKDLLLKCREPEAEFAMSATSKQEVAKPGTCRVKDDQGKLEFELYFDGGGERKLQIKKLRKELCIVHATWKFKLSQLNAD